MGWGSDALYGVMDFFTTSEAEANLKKYERVVKDLEHELETISKKITEIADTIIDIHTSMVRSGDQSSGKMIYDFETRRDENKSTLNKLVYYYSTMETNVKNKMEIAKEECNRWKAIADKEDAEKKEYKEDEND